MDDFAYAINARNQKPLAHDRQRFENGSETIVRCEISPFGQNDKQDARNDKGAIEMTRVTLGLSQLKGEVSTTETI
jgi:hypothetical protein